MQYGQNFHVSLKDPKVDDVWEAMEQGSAHASMLHSVRLWKVTDLLEPFVNGGYKLIS